MQTILERLHKLIPYGLEATIPEIGVLGKRKWLEVEAGTKMHPVLDRLGAQVLPTSLMILLTVQVKSAFDFIVPAISSNDVTMSLMDLHNYYVGCCL